MWNILFEWKIDWIVQIFSKLTLISHFSLSCFKCQYNVYQKYYDYAAFLWTEHKPYIYQTNFNNFDQLNSIKCYFPFHKKFSLFIEKEKINTREKKNHPFQMKLKKTISQQQQQQQNNKNEEVEDMFEYRVQCAFFIHIHTCFVAHSKARFL